MRSSLRTDRGVDRGKSNFLIQPGKMEEGIYSFRITPDVGISLFENRIHLFVTVSR